MKPLLKSKGYKFTKNDTLNNREFRESTKSFEINDEESSFSEQVYNIIEEWELFLDERLYTETKIKAILDATRDEGVDEVVVIVDRQERGFLITFNTIKEGVT